MRSTLLLRPVPEASDPFVVLVVAVVMLVVCMFAAFTAKDAKDRTIRLLVVYLAYGACEVVVKRLAHFTWFLYPIRFSLFFVVLLSWSQWRGTRRRNARAPHAGVLGAYLLLAGIQVFNPLQGNPIIGVLGWLTDFMFAAFYFVAFDLFDDAAAMRRLLKATAWIGVASAVVCFLEQWRGPEELMKQYPMYVHLVHFTPRGDAVYRPSSLSPYVEIFAVAAMLGLLAARRGKPVIVGIGIALCIVANLLHAVRIVWMTGFGILACFLLLNRGRRIVSAALVVASIALAVNIGVTVTEGSISSSLNSATQPLTTFQRSRLWGVMALPTVVAEYPFGIGVGEGSPGLRFLDAGDDVTTFGTHNYLTDLAGQMSLLGPILLIAFAVRVDVSGWTAIRRAGQNEWRVQVVTAVAIVTAVAVSLFGGGGLVAYPVSEYFWLMAGAAVALASKPARAMLQRQAPLRQTVQKRLTLLAPRAAALRQRIG